MDAFFPFQYVFCRRFDITPAVISGIYVLKSTNLPFQYVFFRRSGISPAVISGIYVRKSTNLSFQYVFFRRSGISPAVISGIYVLKSTNLSFQYVFFRRSGSLPAVIPSKKTRHPKSRMPGLKYSHLKYFRYEISILPAESVPFCVSVHENQ